MSAGEGDYTTFTGRVDFANSTTTTQSTGGSGHVHEMTLDELSMKSPRNFEVEELEKIKNKKDNSYVLLISRRPKDHDPNSDWAGSQMDYETTIFDTFDACNVTEQILRKDNAREVVSIRKFFYHNEKFFEMTGVN